MSEFFVYFHCEKNWGKLGDHSVVSGRCCDGEVQVIYVCDKCDAYHESYVLDYKPVIKDGFIQNRR